MLVRLFSGAICGGLIRRGGVIRGVRKIFSQEKIQNFQFAILNSESTIFDNNLHDNYKRVLTRSFYKKKVYKKMRLKWSKSYENLKKITMLNFQKFSVFIG